MMLQVLNKESFPVVAKIKVGFVSGIIGCIFKEWIPFSCGQSIDVFKTKLFKKTKQ
jgi:hypothetical protein